ncbi:MAG: WhiB family transcriptional regulator [Acidimicrobiales bacterium]|jgi:WhiB family redox-sensing transcriptional regulator|nr:WhiB family transcriptional regulator [Acidimicrobiales bacterium]
MTRWQDHAACRGLDPALFFPDEDPDGGPGAEVTADAIRICGGCGVREHCLETALLRREPAGVWGGATDQERRRIIRRRRRAA